MATARPRPYRRILTSALHRRFVHASALALLVDYIVAFAIGTKTSFLWSWLPIGICGLRTLLLSISSLAVFVLRIGQMHVGPRTASSPIATFRHVFPLQAVQTFGWYLFSAWWFSEIYVWSASQNADLGWVKPARPNERITLNERPIYLHTYHIMLAILQASLHLYFDYDCLDIPVAKRDPKSPDQRIHPVDSVFKRIQKKTAEASSIYAAALLVTAASPFIYLLFLRRLSWSFSLYFAKLFWNFPRSAAVPPGRVPLILFTLFGHQALSGLGLLAVWQSANIFFTVFITQEPLKRGQPLTTETKDPTGSLINGLKAKKATVKTFAFWELSFISLRVPDRRKAIFSDIDRQDGPAWTQILHASVENVKNITARISHYKNPAPLLAPKSAPTTQAQLQTLPQLTEPPRHENILVASPKAGSLRGKFEESVGAVAKSYGQATDWTPTARAKAKEAFTHASNAMLSPERKKKLLAAAPEEARLLTGPPGNPSTSSTAAGIPFITQFLRSPIGKPFRQTYSRRLRSIVLGSPDGQLSPIVDAIDSMTRLLIASLAEDPYGKVQTDIPAVVRLFTDTIITLEGFVHDGLDIHWTDVTFPPPTDPEAQEKARHVHEVDTVLNTLRASLSDLLAAFTPYLSDVGLRGRDLRLAKVAADLSDETD